MTVKTPKVQVGISSDANKNFVIDASQADNTLKISRGNAGATTQDVLTVSASGNVLFPMTDQTLSSNGYTTLPGGLIMQWGRHVTSTGGGNGIVFPKPFPSALYSVVLTPDIGVGANAVFPAVDLSSSTLSAATIFARNANNTTYLQVAVFWVAIGR